MNKNDISSICIALIRSFEGFRSLPYCDNTGRWTIGYGHTKNVTANTSAITEEQAEDFLQQDLTNAASDVTRLVHVPLNDNQYAALVSLVYNAGAAPLEKTLGAKLNAGDYAGAADEFTKWIYTGGEVSNGLIRRREAERELFVTASL